MIAMETTIQISTQLRDTLQTRKLSDSESYENVILNLVEDCMEISEQTKEEIEESRKQVKQKKVKNLSQIKKELGLNV